MLDRSGGRGGEDLGRSPLARSLPKPEHNLNPRSSRMYDGHPYVTRRAVNQWIRAGAWRENTVSSTNANPFKVLTATRVGAELARRKAVEAGLDPCLRT